MLCTLAHGAMDMKSLSCMSDADMEFDKIRGISLGHPDTKEIFMLVILLVVLLVFLIL
jgi:hypothetical protein